MQNASVTSTSSCGTRVEYLGNEYITFEQGGTKHFVQYQTASKPQETVNVLCPGTKFMNL
jgi:hypothetical protein